jgi:hypothetical protein
MPSRPNIASASPIPSLIVRDLQSCSR